MSLFWSKCFLKWNSGTLIKNQKQNLSELHKHSAQQFVLIWRCDWYTMVNTMNESKTLYLWTVKMCLITCSIPKLMIGIIWLIQFFDNGETQLLINVQNQVRIKFGQIFLFILFKCQTSWAIIFYFECCCFSDNNSHQTPS